MARTSPPARSPRARALPAARAALPAPGGVRRAGRGSSRDELEPVGHVARLPTCGLDLGTEPVSLLEVARGARLLPLLCELDDLARRFLLFGKRREPEDVERATQQLVVAPAVHHGERIGGVEVVLERCLEAFPLSGRCGLGWG